jgi:beta-RFAP synthase
MIRVTAPARLHFGLLSLAADGADFWPGRHGTPALPVRRFGGVGLMIQEPALRLRIEPAASWSAEGPLADRALEFARRFTETLSPGALAPQHLVIESAPPAHSGLGTGTQLGMAVARALAHASGLTGLAPPELAARVGRGLRSALGVHGSGCGGLLVEGGKRGDEGLSPLIVRLPFPEAWRIVVAIPPGVSGLHGDHEREAFRRLQDRSFPPHASATLCRVLLLGLLPAVVECDLEMFGEALHEYNARAGEVFAPLQGGTYANRAVAEVVAFLRRQGVRGVGQSSWGPAVFAVAGEEDAAGQLARHLRDGYGLGADRVVVTQGCNHGTEVG